MKVLLTALIVANMAFGAGEAFARRGGGHGGGGFHQPQMEKFVLKFNHMHLRGQSTIGIKRELNQQIGGLDLRSKTIEKVVLFAKSKKGQGSVSLAVGPKMSMTETVQGAPFIFHETHPVTYQRIVLEDPSTDDQGRWQLKLRGNIKVLKAAVFLKDEYAFNDKIVINMGDAHYRGQNTLKLKQLVKDMYPGMNLRRLDLESVKIVAKSKHGQGTATLRVGQDYSAPVVLDGFPSDFHNSAPFTYDRELIYSPSFSGGGAWQLLLRGNIKVKKIVLKVDSI